VGSDQKLEEVPADAVADEPVTAENLPASLRHEFQLRDGYKVAMDLPSDMTEKEAERLALFIKALPF
jgi:hypothetical protein